MNFKRLITTDWFVVFAATGLMSLVFIVYNQIHSQAYSKLFSGSSNDNNNGGNTAGGGTNNSGSGSGASSSGSTGVATNNSGNSNSGNSSGVTGGAGSTPEAQLDNALAAYNGKNYTLAMTLAQPLADQGVAQAGSVFPRIMTRPISG